MFDIEASFIKALIGGLIGFLFYKVKKMEDKVDKAIDEAHARTIIADKLAPLELSDVDVKEDIRRLERKIDMLIDLQIKKD